MAACGAGEPVNYPNYNTDIICLGDSLTAGYGAQDDQSYPARLALMTERKVINLGFSGDTSGDGLARVEQVFKYNPYMVLIEFGGNDARKQIAPQVTKQNVLEIVRRVQAAGAIAVVVDTGGNILLSKYSTAMKEIARETNSLYVPPILDGILNDRNLKSDMIHPNAQGYQRVADKVYKHIKKFI